MNKKIEKILHERNIHPIGYQIIKNSYIINTKEMDYVIKDNTNNYDIYKYLISRNFDFFPNNFSTSLDNYDISEYIKGLKVSDEQKVSDYIKLISLLHMKTSYKREIDLDEIKEKYEEIINNINDLKIYYQQINEQIEHELFLSPSHYLLIRNISLIYNILNNIDVLINNVYESIKNKKSIRVSLLHNNIDLDHLIISEKKYLISWDKAYFDNPIYELNDVYRKYYHIIELNDLLNIYETSNKLSLIEKRLLIIYLAIPKKILFTNNTFNDTIIVNNEIKYLSKVYELLNKYKNEL